MKKYLLFLSILLTCNFAFANENVHNAIYDKDRVAYSLLNSRWQRVSFKNDSINLVKQLVEGTGSCSVYNHEDGTLAFALATDCELINNGKLIIIDNNLLKYYKLIYNGKSFEQVLLTDDEIKSIFPNAELFKLSTLDNDNKVWIHKPFLKKKTILLVNDTENCYHKLNTKSKNVQDSEIKGLITFNNYSIVRFKHFGVRDGKLIFYIR
jgi:hypothetical protein